MQAEIFGYTLTPGQLKIVGSILDPTVKRLSICAMTRYGKTRAAAIAVMLYTLTHSNKRIFFIAPTNDQTNIIRNYTADLIAQSPQLAALVDTPARGDPTQLKKEVSKKRVTFKNGCEIQTLTAYGAGEEPGKQIMGFGGDLVLLDEAALILDEVYTSRISRMLGDSPDSKLVELVNPWHRHNFAWRHWQNPDFKHIHIDWQQALAEGRTTETYINEQREELSDYEFKVLYDSIFAEDSEDTLIRWSWIEAATKRVIEFKVPVHNVWGLDVGEKGPDLTVLTKCESDGTQYVHKETYVIKEKDTMPIANRVSQIVPKGEQINVDSIGVGAGVHSRLAELGHKAASVRVSMSPTSHGERYLNMKAQNYWRLRTIFEQGLIAINKEDKLMSQLGQMRYEFTSAGKIRIIDPTAKSPDYSDSLMLAIATDSYKPWVKSIQW